MTLLHPKDLIVELKTARKDLVKNANRNADKIIKKVEKMIDGGGNGIGDIGNIMREKFDEKYTIPQK